jgi:uncharacterized membrane protein
VLKLKTALLLFLALPFLIPCLIIGWGWGFGFIVCLCYHVAPETTGRCVHSYIVMRIWECVVKGM